MKPVKILSASGGIDVVSPETEIANGCVRVAENVVIHSDGGFDRRDGATRTLSLANMRDVWTCADGSLTLAAAGTTIYRIDGTPDAPIATAIATNIGAGPISYEEEQGDIYIGCAGVLRLRAGVIAKPGVASLIGNAPTLTATDGGLRPGTYAVAFGGVTAGGEESGLSDVEWIELPNGGGIVVTLPAAPSGVSRWRIYRTPPNESELYTVETIAVASSYTIAGGETGRQERTFAMDLLPSGSLGIYRGRMYSAVGSVLFYSPTFNYGLTDARDGFIPFGEDITLHRPVKNGIFVGTANAVYFLNGSGPKDFKLERAANNGAFKQPSHLVDGEMFNPKLVDGAKQVALWLSPLGYQIGLPSGEVVSPQADKVRLSDIERVSTLAFLLGGVKQIVSAVETMNLGNGGATDTTP